MSILAICILFFGLDHYAGHAVDKIHAYIIDNRGALIFDETFEEHADKVIRLWFLTRPRLVRVMKKAQDNHLYIHSVYLVFRTGGLEDIDVDEIYRRFPRETSAAGLVMPMNVVRYMAQRDAGILRQGIERKEWMALRVAALIDEGSVPLVPALLAVMNGDDEEMACMAAKAILASKINNPEIKREMQRIISDYQDDRVEYARKILRDQ